MAVCRGESGGSNARWATAQTSSARSRLSGELAGRSRLFRQLCPGAALHARAATETGDLGRRAFRAYMGHLDALLLGSWATRAPSPLSQLTVSGGGLPHRGSVQ